MESLTSKEFFEQLQKNTLKPALILKGIVKKSDKDAEVLFAKKGDFMNWIKVPASMVESVNVWKTFSKENETFALVKLRLKAPSNSEAQVLYDLLLSIKAQEREGEKHSCYGMGEFLFKEGAEHFGEHCKCGCHHDYGDYRKFECGPKHYWKK